MSYKHQSQINTDEHATIGGVDGKKVFVIDNQGNQIVSFSSPTVTQVPYSVYQDLSLVSGYNFYGFCTPGSNPTTLSFKLMREELDRGIVLFGGGTSEFIHAWSSASLASISWS